MIHMTRRSVYVAGKDHKKAGRDFNIHKVPDFMPRFSAFSTGDL